MDISRVDQLIQYAVAVAGRQDIGKRELGPIHIIKFVYLADLAHAEANDGETYTGLPWRFYNFGPWTGTVNDRIEPALAAIGAELKTYHSPKYMEDAKRWSVVDSELAERLEQEISSVFAALAISGAVSTYGTDTERLLYDIYETVPMLRAAPDEFLDFSDLPKRPKRPELPPKLNLSIGQQKRRVQKLMVAKELLSNRLKKKRELKSALTPTLPRYDEVFVQGTEQLDLLIEKTDGVTKITCSISDDVWKSKARHDPDLS